MWRWIALGYAVLFEIFFLLIGKTFGQYPDVGWLMATEMSWVDHGTLIAWWLTWLCYPQVLLPICVVLIAVAIAYPRWRPYVIFSIIAVLLAWLGADFFQHFFMRPRRLDWVVKHETAFSYPSSHAAIVTALYFLWALFIARSNLAGRTTASVLLALLGCAILWSRLALGAHYLTDLIGGVLWGLAVVALLTAVFPINVFTGRSESSLE